MTEAMNEQNEFQAAWNALKSLVYGGGNIGADGKDDGGHRLIKGQILYDDWNAIRKSLEFMAANHEALRDEKCPNCGADKGDTL